MATYERGGENTSTLAHVYFFLDRVSFACDAAGSEQSTKASASPDLNSAATKTSPQIDAVAKHNTQSNGFATAKEHTRTSSPSNSATGSEATTTTGSSGSDLNPLASSFQPSVLPPVAPTSLHESQLYELRETSDRGKGLFAASFIPIGTMLICEEPLFTIPPCAPQLVWGPYSRLSNAEKRLYDKLHGFTPEDLDLEQVSRTCLVDPNVGDDEIEENVEEHVRVMSIFMANNISFEHKKKGRSAIFAAFSRLNHSCVPNVHHSWNPNLGKLTVHTIRDIQPGEELLTTYLGDGGVYQVRATRIELLRSGYGFTCRCAVCSDHRLTPDGMKSISDAERDVMVGISWGLDQYSSGAMAGPASTDTMKNAFLPDTHLDAFQSAETLVVLMLRQNLVGTELQKAYHKASVAALAIKDYDKAILYARNEAQVERNCLGTDVGDLRQLGVAAECWWVKLLNTIQAEAGDDVVRGYLHIPGSSDGNGKGKKRKSKKKASDHGETVKKNEMDVSSGHKKDKKVKLGKKQIKDRGDQRLPGNGDSGPGDINKEDEGSNTRDEK